MKKRSTNSKGRPSARLLADAILWIRVMKRIGNGRAARRYERILLQEIQ
jgi:hypothetical protein